jgi:hypothetical protein
MTSTTGINRNSYTHYEDAIQPRLVTFSSEDGNNPDITHKHRHSNYMVNVKDIEVKPNQILTAYVYSCNIPTTFYQINRFNDTFFLHLPDWGSVYFHPTEKGGSRYNSLDKGVIPIVLDRRNYTNTQLKIQIQKQLDAIITNYKVSFDSVFNTVTMANTNAQTDVPTYFKCKILKTDLNLDTTAINTLGNQTPVQFTKIKTAGNGGLPVKDITYSSTKYKFNNVVATTYPDATGNLTRPSRIWFGIGTDSSNNTEEVWVLSEPRFDVKIEDNGKIRIDRVDFLGHIPPVNTSEIHRFYVSSGNTHYLHLGLNKPSWGSSIGNLPSSSDFKINTYNSTAQFDDTRFVGSIMSSHYQKEEYDTVKTSIDTTYKQRIFFPNMPMTNALSSVEIRSSRIRANVREKGVHSTVLAKIPIDVQQNSFINYVNDNPIRYNLGQGNISLIDINLTDRYGQLLDFNGCPNTISILFETWNIVDIPLNRHNESLTYNNPNARNAKDLHFPTTYDRIDLGMGTSMDYQRGNIQKGNYQNTYASSKPNNSYTLTNNKAGIQTKNNQGNTFGGGKVF